MHDSLKEKIEQYGKVKKEIINLAYKFEEELESVKSSVREDLILLRNKQIYGAEKAEMIKQMSECLCEMLDEIKKDNPNEEYDELDLDMKMFCEWAIGEYNKYKD